MLERLFGWGKKKDPATADPAISFGRYSDNNKSLQKVARWTDADNLFKEKKYTDSFDAFFQYLCDDETQNVVHERNGTEGRFHFYQGSKIVRGSYNADAMQAEITLAKMPQPSVPVMRKLLEMNFSLYYSRFALDGERLCMRFDSDIETANPSKLYYGLKELSTKADKQDDLLVENFSMLQTLDTEHVIEIPQQEKEVKHEFFQKWISETVAYIKTLDADKFSGGIAYLLLALCYRLDYLLVPEGKLLHEIEKIVDIYFKKDERPTTEKNRDMLAAFEQLQNLPKEDVFKSLYRSKHTFSIVAPQVHKTIADAIYNANQNIAWYRDNNYPQIGEKIAEYGISFCQYSYSLPKPVTDLLQIFMMVNYSDYFKALGFSTVYYDAATKQFFPEAIAETINAINNKWKAKFSNMWFKPENISYENLLNFNVSFTNEIQFLNFDVKQ